MYEKLNLFYDEVVRISKSMNVLPTRTSSLIYDERFSPAWLIEKIKSNDISDISPDGGYCYSYLIEEVVCMMNSNLSYICASYEVREYDMDYSYYTGYIRDDVPFIFRQSDHEWIFPNQLILYGEEIQINILTDRIDIEILDVVPTVRDLFYMPKSTEIIESLIGFLKNTDRTLMDSNYSKK